MSKNTYSILHISDLHKRDDDDYDNLLQSMKEDCEKYVLRYNLPKPEIIIISGDIVKGGKPEEISSQYSQVSEFLNNLTEFFLENDKSRIIIVPGNHDVDWNKSKISMCKHNDTEKVLDKIKNNPKIRWSWNELCLYRIIDEDMYNSRLDGFITFYDNFYAGIKSYSKESKEQYQIFDIPNLNTACVAYNSCYRNDHLNTIGCIHPSCISKSSDELDKLHKMGRLLVGVWHHHTSGLPIENNYLDYRILKTMIDKNIQIGLFGHQHLCNIVNEYKNIIDDKRILLIGAGTLYGDRNSLPPNTQRQYNIIVIQFNETDINCRFFIREDKSQAFEIPMWDEGKIEGTLSSSWSTSLLKPKQPNIETILNQIIVESEKNNNIDSAVDQLIQLDTSNSLVRKVLLEFLDKKRDYNLIYKYYEVPENNTEAIFLMEAVSELNDKEKIKKILAIPFIYENQDIAVKEQRRHLGILVKEDKYGTN
jgi:predicted phosphodiesterase